VPVALVGAGEVGVKAARRGAHHCDAAWHQPFAPQTPECLEARSSLVAVDIQHVRTGRSGAMATFLPGTACHHDLMRSGSVVASWKPCWVAGAFSSGCTGRTGQPAWAYASAARRAVPS